MLRSRCQEQSDIARLYNKGVYGDNDFDLPACALDLTGDFADSDLKLDDASDKAPSEYNDDLYTEEDFKFAELSPKSPKNPSSKVQKQSMPRALSPCLVGQYLPGNPPCYRYFLALLYADTLGNGEGNYLPVSTA